MALTPDVFKESWIYQDALAEGKLEGKLEGKAEGVVETIRRLLTIRFGSEAFPDLERVPSDKLTGLVDSVIGATSAAEARAAISRVLRVR